MKTIFKDYGIEILIENNQYYIEYDAGEIAQKFVTIKVSEEDANIAQKSSNDAYNVILKYQ